MTKILSWNVNSLRIRLAELERIACEENPDVVCLQEVKAKEEDFPFAAVKAAGFEHIALYGMAGYNGVAILSRRPLTGVRRFDWAGKADARHISAVTEEGIEIHNIYIPRRRRPARSGRQPGLCPQAGFYRRTGRLFCRPQSRRSNTKNARLRRF